MKLPAPLSLNDGESELKPTVLRDITVVAEVGDVISVRSAKAHLSGLLDLVSRGREVVITSDGKPKARLVPMETARKRKPFAFSPGYKAAPWRGGPTAEEIVRGDRDSRGW